MNDEETKRRLEEIGEHIGKRIAEPYPALDFTAPRIASAADRALLHDLAVLLAERTAGVLRAMRTETITFDALTAVSTATTAATTALLAC